VTTTIVRHTEKADARIVAMVRHVEASKRDKTKNYIRRRH